MAAWKQTEIAKWNVGMNINESNPGTIYGQVLKRILESRDNWCGDQNIVAVFFWGQVSYKWSVPGKRGQLCVKPGRTLSGGWEEWNIRTLFERERRHPRWNVDPPGGAKMPGKLLPFLLLTGCDGHETKMGLSGRSDMWHHSSLVYGHPAVNLASARIRFYARTICRQKEDRWRIPGNGTPQWGPVP